MLAIKNRRRTKAEITNVIIVAVVIISMIAILSIIFSDVFIDIIQELRDTGGFSSETDQVMSDVQSKTIPLLDFMIFFAFASFVIGGIVASIYMDFHPAIIVGIIVIMIVGVIIAAQFANVISDLGDQVELADTAPQFRMTNAILGQYFPLLILIVGAIMVVIIYGKSRRVGEV